jgi:hypothetical protein
MRPKKLLLAIAAAALVTGAFVAAQAAASSAPIAISYLKTCDLTVGHCLGTAGNGGKIEMQITSFRPTGDDAQLTLTEWITVGEVSFTAEMRGHQSPDGFIVLNGTVTAGSFTGAEVHQRSTYLGGPATASVWGGELRLLPASA